MSYSSPTFGTFDVSGIKSLLPVYPTKDITVLKQDLRAYQNDGIATTTGTSQLLFDVAPSVMAGVSSNCIMNINADMSFIDLSGNPAGWRFGVTQSDTSGITYFTRSYITDVSSTMMSAAPTLVLNRAVDYPLVDASLNVFLEPADIAGYDIPTGITLLFGYGIQSLP